MQFFHDDDTSLLTQVVTTALSTQQHQKQTRPFFNIPSLSGDHSLLFSATQVCSALRREVLAWSAASSSSNENESVKLKNQRNVFWSLVVAHTSSFESQHHHPRLSWLVPAILCSVLRASSSSSSSSSTANNNNKTRTLAFLRSIQRNNQHRWNDVSGSNNSNGLFRIEHVPISRRWVDVAFSALMIDHHQFDLRRKQEVAVAIVNGLLGAWTQRGIYVDRVKVAVVVVNDDDDNQQQQQEVELKRGMQLPFPLPLEGMIVWRRWQKQENQNSNTLQVHALLVSCSILEEAEAELLIEFARQRFGNIHTSSGHRVLLLCQRLVSSDVRALLAEDGILALDRLAITHFPVVQQLLRVTAPLQVISKVTLLDEKNVTLVVPCHVSLLNSSSSGRKLLWISALPEAKEDEQQQFHPPTISTIIIRVPPLVMVSSARAIEDSVRAALRNVSQLLVDDTCIVYKKSKDFGRIVASVFFFHGDGADGFGQRIAGFFHSKVRDAGEEQSDEDDEDQDEHETVDRLAAFRGAIHCGLELAIALMSIVEVV